MRNKNKVFTIIQSFFILSIALLTSCNSSTEAPRFSETILSDGWKLQSAEKIAIKNDSEVSTKSLDSSTWLDAEVPGTVMGSLVSNKVIDDPYFGINMKKVDKKQFDSAWWYRKTFNISSEDLSKHISLRFNGINYRADLWVNGKKVVGKEEFAGTYLIFSYDISNFVVEGENVVALKMIRPQAGEFSTGFVDWNPLPPDANMGIFRDVILEINDGVKIRSPFVYSKVDKKQYDNAQLFLQTIVENNTDKAVSGKLVIDFEHGKVEKDVTINANEEVNFKFNPTDYKSLNVTGVNYWWPNGMGDPTLYKIKVEFVRDNVVIDAVEDKYGIREIESTIDERGNKSFTVNGKFVLLKGGGWADDLLLQDTKESVEAQINYIKHMNMNSVRLEGFWGKDKTIYELCDEYGIMIMVGWNCHWEWEDYLGKPTDEKYGGATSEVDIKLMEDYWKAQMLWIRNHPSIYIWMLGSDKLPTPDLERNYIKLFNEYDPSRSYATSAGGVGTEDNNVVANVSLFSEVSGGTGMKMLGPYAYTPPVYWFKDTEFGGAYGFNTETSPGPNIPTLSSLKKMMPEDKLWPMDKEYWEYHSGRNAFQTLDRYIKAINERYGEATNVEDFAYKCQLINYELMRPQFEAFVANKPVSTGLVQWMLNSAWPEMYWQLYDSYLQPNGAFYATRKANTPLHAIYRYGFDDIYISNESLLDVEGLTVKVRAYDINSKQIFADEWKGRVNTNTSKFIYKLPDFKGKTSTYFLDLRIVDKDGKEVDNNFYWLSTKKDVLDYEAANKLEWPFYTPSKEYSDFKAINKMDKVELKLDYSSKLEGDKVLVSVKINNQSNKIAFFNYFDIVEAGTQNTILPIYWSDNYVSLLPGESKVLTAYYDRSLNATNELELMVKGVNVDKKTYKMKIE